MPLAATMHRGRKPDGRRAHAARRQRRDRRSGTRGNGELAARTSSSVATRPGASIATPDVTMSGRPEPSRTAPIASMARRSSAELSANLEKSWLKAVWITPSDWAAPLLRLSRSSSDPR
jgi:hypothetical protein